MPSSLPVDELRAAARTVMISEGFEPDFPPAVLREVSRMTEPPPAAELAEGRRDLRSLLWSSIDNRESLDLDQVEVAERLPDGTIRLMVGIADVDELVAKGSATDQHAQQNTTSVYTGVEVFPMLPERLSTNLTSLAEGEDRPAIVIELDVASDGTVTHADAYRALLRNRAKLAYEDVGEWLAGEGPVPAAVARTPGLPDQLRLQDEAAQRLRAFRIRHGALYLETLEARPVVVEGRVIDVALVQRNRARDLIEALMVAANVAVAKYLESRRVPALRRVVRAPKRWDRIVAIAHDMGHELPPTPDPQALGAFLAERRAADPVHFPDLSLTIVKLLGPGEYIVERRGEARADDGHFGLGAAEYTHSTAPNRRFPDLVAQRLIKFARGIHAQPYTDDELQAIATHCTTQEDAARKVERTMRKRAAAVMMEDRIGDTFPAIVTGASAKGTYVRLLSPPVEGRVVKGEDGVDVGDTIRVRLLDVDPDKGYIDFENVGGKETARKLERSRRKKRAAVRLASHIGELFDAVVTKAALDGTFVRLTSGDGEGRVIRGHHDLKAGEHIRVKLVDTDPVHGFIDFVYEPGIAPSKLERTERKRRAARALRHRIGATFDAVVSGVTPKAVWIRTTAPEAVEGRLVRGTKGLGRGDHLRVRLLAVDPQRGWIDFARE